MSRLVFLILILHVISILGGDSDDENDFTINCGSAIKLHHVQNPSYFLNSGAFNWSTGSGQQVVTLKESKGDSSSLWQIQEAFQKQCETGKPIRCGETIRLMHIDTKKRLHSHPLKSVLSNGHEVSGFGDLEGGDKSDDWEVACSDQYWMTGRKVRFLHVGTQTYLSSMEHKFTRSNCPSCPIIDELEVTATKTGRYNSFFKATSGGGAHVSKV